MCAVIGSSWSKYELPKMLIFLDAMSRAQQDATVWQNLRVTEPHGDGKALQACETLTN